MISESFSNNPLSEIIPSYAYFQYADDISIQAFIESYNGITQSYLNWFLETPLSVYTSPAINGVLLDWIGQSIYGYPRPFLLAAGTNGLTYGWYGFSIFGDVPFGERKQIPGKNISSSVSDDIYKRALTWNLYLGDGKQMTIQWLKRRIARFLYGINGTDVSIDYLQNISISFNSIPGTLGYFGSKVYFGEIPFGSRKTSSTIDKQLTITLPSTPASSILQALMKNGYLALPFQVNLKVLLS